MTCHNRFTSSFGPCYLTMTCDHNLTTSFGPSSKVNPYYATSAQKYDISDQLLDINPCKYELGS